MQNGIFDICDEKGSPTGKIVEQSVAHAQGICHRTAHVWAIRKSENGWEVLLQKRTERTPPQDPAYCVPTEGLQALKEYLRGHQQGQNLAELDSRLD